MHVKTCLRALRLPFLSASVLPFIYGSLASREGHPLNLPGLLLGSLAAGSMHLSANLINDYADSRSGADWHDKTFYGFFGGSKLIQEGILTEKFYLYGAAFFGGVAFLASLTLSFLLGSPISILSFLLILVLGWSYSCPPLCFAYRKTGEFFIFILFGPAIVMGASYIQNGIFPDLKSLFLSLPFGFFTTAILFANEVPDYQNDLKSGKRTWVTLLGPEKSYLLYYLILFLGFSSVLLNDGLGYAGNLSLLSYFLFFPGIKAAKILASHSHEPSRLVESSKWTILIQTLFSLILILDAALMRTR